MVNIVQQQNVTVVELGPEYHSLDTVTMQRIGQQLLDAAGAADPPRMIVDMSHTEFIGSQFIELVVRVHKRLSDRGGLMALCGVHAFCADVLRIVKLDRLWSSYSTREEALSALET